MDKQYDKQYNIQYHGLPKDERDALDAFLTAEEQDERVRAVEAYARMRHRKRLSQRRRREEDRASRTMLAIHVPFDYAQLVQDEADRAGVSVYRFMRRALDRAMQET